MFNITYETWEKVVKLYFETDIRKLNSYLQWYPFTRKASMTRLLEREYFDEFIDKGYFLLDENLMRVQRNYMQRSNGQYRQSQLISPIMYLLLQAICVNISDNVESQRNEAIKVYYSGNLHSLNPLYQEEYSNFYKEVILTEDIHDYFIKLDISNYFPNINIDKLFSKIEKKSSGFDQIELLMYKEFIKYIGNGNFPVIQNSMGTSYLATDIYLEEIDNTIFDYLSHINLISRFKMIRYVDDLYILFDSKADGISMANIFEEFQKFVNTLFHANELNLNSEKIKYGDSSRISEVLSTPYYEEIVNGEEFDIYELDVEKAEQLLLDFLTQVELEIENKYILTNKRYIEIIENIFSIEANNLSPSEILNRVIYSNDLNFTIDPIKSKVLNVTDVHILRTTPKVFLTLLLNTRDGERIREVLNNLFIKSREGFWMLNDLEIAITYLMKRRFSHYDLIEALVQQSPENISLYQFIDSYCIKYEWQYKSVENIKVFKHLKVSKLTLQIFFLYLCNKKRDDYLAAYSYYKSFFDRITAEFAWSESGFTKNANYKSYHQSKVLKKFYERFDGSREIIDEASKFRNFNPINHGSAELLSGDTISKEMLAQSLEKLSRMIYSYIESIEIV
ncbi:AbiA family abortive infection protein [Fundicoccus sp. Sow4_F4]|uniref:AbiA family abortive infection protein n=1 Tax=Fundicoccus sp. Sow4_F4 TaxID=3438783 RepID=UPI003F8F6E99